MFTITIDTFEALVDLECALDYEIDNLMEYRHRSDREAEALDNLLFLRNQVINQRAPITEQRKLQAMLEVIPWSVPTATGKVPPSSRYHSVTIVDLTHTWQTYQTMLD